MTCSAPMIARMMIVKKNYAPIIMKRVRCLCDKRGLSINALAELSGVPQSTLDNWANGRAGNPTIRTLHRIATAFNMTIAEFLDFDEMNEFPSEDEQDL